MSTTLGRAHSLVGTHLVPPYGKYLFRADKQQMKRPQGKLADAMHLQCPNPFSKPLPPPPLEFSPLLSGWFPPWGGGGIAQSAQ